MSNQHVYVLNLLKIKDTLYEKEDIELLAPAGSFDALKAAVQNGANAIYLGGQKFGARAFAHNFDYEALKQAVNYCHLKCEIIRYS